MRIGLVWQADYPWEVRVEKFVRTFVRLGHDVHLLANNSGRQPTRERLNGFTVHRLPEYVLPLPISVTWYKAIRNLITQERIDLLIVRDLPLYAPAFAAAKLRNTHLWFDMAEDYPAMLAEMERSVAERLSVRNYYLARLYERLALRTADIVSVVVQESLERVQPYLRRSAQVLLISNYPEKDFGREVRAMGIANDVPRLVYHGALGPERDLETVLRAAAILGKRIRLVVVGGDDLGLGRLRERAQELGVLQQLEVIGRVSYAQLPKLLSGCDFGIVPHRNTRHTQTTIPNKLFEYMAVGKPVIVSDVWPLRRVVEGTGAGLVYKDQDHYDLACKIEYLIGHPDIVRRMGRLARSAYESTYNWSTAEAGIVAVLEMLDNSAAPRPVVRGRDRESG